MCSSFARGSASSHLQPEVDLVEADDACDVDTDSEGVAESCGLSLRQLRGKQLQVHAAGSAPINAWKPWDAALADPSSGDLLTFYMYRVVSDEVYPPINVNTANIGGVLWYLHHEVVIQYPRKFDITRVMRMKVQMRATKPLLDLAMNFGPRTAFDSGQCTGPFVCGRNTEGGNQPKFCNGAFDKNNEADILAMSGKPYEGSYEYSKFGYHVGCNNLGEYPFPTYKVFYPRAAWYSLPGACLSEVFSKWTPQCKAQEPGGLCEGTPTGAGNCTWSYEVMGEVSLDELVGQAVDELHKSGGREYDPIADKGHKFSFWDGINNTDANAKRIKALQKLFAEKFPNQALDEDIPSPPCDFNFGTFYKEFWYKDPFSGKCEDAKVGSACADSVKWGISDGIYVHPEWFPGLTSNSTFKDFQRLFYAQGKAACPYRPCDEPVVDAPRNDDDEGFGNTTSTLPGPEVEPEKEEADDQVEARCSTTPVSSRRGDSTMSSCRRRHSSPSFADSDQFGALWTCDETSNAMRCDPVKADLAQASPCLASPVSRRRRAGLMLACRRRQSTPGLWDSDSLEDLWTCNQQADEMMCKVVEVQ